MTLGLIWNILTETVFQQRCLVRAEAVLNFVHVMRSQQAAYKMFVFYSKQL